MLAKRSTGRQSRTDIDTLSYVMTPDALLEKLKTCLADKLVSVTLYGPAAILEEGEMPANGSRENALLIITRDLELDTLRCIAEPIRTWREAGNPAPLLFTEDRIKNAADSFPVEILDMKEARKVLYGEDSILHLELNRTNFQQELVYALKSTLIRLRNNYFNQHDNAGALRRGMLEALTELRLYLRAATRLYVPVCPASNSGVLNAMKVHIPIDPAVFERIETLRETSEETPVTDTEALYYGFIRQIETVIDGIDQLNLRRGATVTYPPFKS